MAEVLINAQSIPAATTLTDAYTVPALTTAVLSSIVVCNQGSSTTFRIAHSIAGAADTAAQYLYYNQAIAANATFTATLGITLTAGDVIRVYSVTGNVSFNIYGSQVT